MSDYGLLGDMVERWWRAARLEDHGWPSWQRQTAWPRRAAGRSVSSVPVQLHLGTQVWLPERVEVTAWSRTRQRSRASRNREPGERHQERGVARNVGGLTGSAQRLRECL
jgi:hypothetical protein